MPPRGTARPRSVRCRTSGRDATGPLRRIQPRRSFMTFRALLIACSLLALPLAARADDVADYAFAQNPGAAVPAGTIFSEADGRRIAFGDLLGHRPIVLALGYFHCPTLCSVCATTSSTACPTPACAPAPTTTSCRSASTPTRLMPMPRRPRPRMRPAIPAAAGGEAPAPTGWHFLTGDVAAVAAVASAVGFRSRYDVHLKQFLHPAGIVVLTPEGRVSGYVLGVGYHAGDLRSAVTTASSGGIRPCGFAAAVALLPLRRGDGPLFAVRHEGVARRRCLDRAGDRGNAAARRPGASGSGRERADA